jgi:serine/threonine protein kinase
MTSPEDKILDIKVSNATACTSLSSLQHDMCDSLSDCDSLDHPCEKEHFQLHHSETVDFKRQTWLHSNPSTTAVFPQRAPQSVTVLTHTHPHVLSMALDVCENINLETSIREFRNSRFTKKRLTTLMLMLRDRRSQGAKQCHAVGEGSYGSVWVTTTTPLSGAPSVPSHSPRQINLEEKVFCTQECIPKDNTLSDKDHADGPQLLCLGETLLSPDTPTPQAISEEPIFICRDRSLLAMKVQDSVDCAFLRELVALRIAKEAKVDGVVSLVGALRQKNLGVIAMPRYDMSAHQWFVCRQGCIASRENDATLALTVARVFSRVGNALARMHCLDVFHRDIKPDNILILVGHRTPASPDGGWMQPDDAVLADFGMALLSPAAESRERHARDLCLLQKMMSVCPIYPPGSSVTPPCNHASPHPEGCKNRDRVLGLSKRLHTLAQRFDMKVASSSVRCLPGENEWRDDSRHVAIPMYKTPTALLAQVYRSHRTIFGGDHKADSNTDPKSCICELRGTVTGHAVDAWAFVMSVGKCLGWHFWDNLTADSMFDYKSPSEGSSSSDHELSCFSVMNHMLSVIGDPGAWDYLPSPCTHDLSCVGVHQRFSAITGAVHEQNSTVSSAWKKLLPVGVPNSAADMFALTLTLDPDLRCTDMATIMAMPFFAQGGGWGGWPRSTPTLSTDVQLTLPILSEGGGVSCAEVSPAHNSKDQGSLDARSSVLRVFPVKIWKMSVVLKCVISYHSLPCEESDRLDRLNMILRSSIHRAFSSLAHIAGERGIRKTTVGRVQAMVGAIIVLCRKKLRVRIVCQAWVLWAIPFLINSDTRAKQQHKSQAASSVRTSSFQTCPIGWLVLECLIGVHSLDNTPTHPSTLVAVARKYKLIAPLPDPLLSGCTNFTLADIGSTNAVSRRSDENMSALPVSAWLGCIFQEDMSSHCVL